MKKQFRILILEDNATDAELARRELRRGNIAFSSRVVATKEGFVRGLQTFAPDLILSDGALSGFDGLSALAIAREKCPDAPFIFFSGTLAEAAGVESLKHGATDYIPKDQCSRLAPAVKRALQDLESRTQRAQTTEALRNSETRFQMLSEGVKDYAIYLLDPDGRVTSWNAGARQSFGYDSDEILGRNYSCLFVPEESRILRSELILQTAREQGRSEEEATRVRKDGSRFWANTITTVVRGDEGGVQGFTCVTRDRTLSRQREAELKNAVQRYRTIAENIPNGIIAIFDRDLRYIDVEGNQALELIGVSKESLEGKTIYELLSPEACREFEPVCQAALAGTTTKTEIPMFGHNYLVHVMPLRNGNGEIGAGIVLSIDITERRLVQDQVRKLNQELEKRVAERTAQLKALKEELDSLDYTLSHGLRAPLGALQCLAEATLEECADQPDSIGKERARRIFASANRMDALLHGLLSYSRLSRDDLELEAVALDSVVRITLCQLEPEIEKRAARITVEWPLPRVMGHPITLVQIMSHLVLNGIKFVASGSKPKVRIHAEMRDSRVHLCVEDNGIGIAREHHTRIFNVFERLHGIEASPDTGIGLAIVRKAAERLGGRVGLESVPGSGSKFWIELATAGQAQ